MPLVMIATGATLVGLRWGGPLLLFVILAVVGLIVGAVRWLSQTREPPEDAQASAGMTGAANPSEVSGIERRQVIKLVGLGALSATSVAVLPTIPFRSARAMPTSAPAAVPLPTGQRVRQWTMIIDLRRCDGCQSRGTPPQCTTACIEGHFVPEPMEWIEVYEHELPGGGTQFLPTPCLQCQNAPCVNVCPVGATFHTPEGTVLIDAERCIGCRLCMAACPYDRRFFNWGQAPIPPEALLADYSPEHQIPARKGTVMKCDFCPEMARAGTLPFCVQACPNRAIYYGDLEEDIATNGKEILRASQLLSENHAFRQKEDLGTEPRVYYIPGHGEAVGRDVSTLGRQPTEWPWIEQVKDAVTWKR